MAGVSGKEKINGFIFNELFNSVCKVDCPHTVNVQRAFRDHLSLSSTVRPQADELAEKWRPNLLDQIERVLVEHWGNLGVPQPLYFLDDRSTLVTWRHPKFTELSGLDPPTSGFFSIFDWLNRLSSQEFLVPCVCLLALLGADPIFITEGSGDGGIDCIGRIKDGPFRSGCLFIQAKTSSTTITRDTILTEYSKYLILPRLEKYRIYCENLGVESSSDGAAFTYLIVSNNEFNGPARKAASHLGVLLRSRSQLAYWLSTRLSLSELDEILKNLRVFTQRGESFINLSPRIKSQIGTW